MSLEIVEADNGRGKLKIKWKKVKKCMQQPFAFIYNTHTTSPLYRLFWAFFMYGMIAQFEVDFWIIYGLVVSTFFFYSNNKMQL